MDGVALRYFILHEKKSSVCDKSETFQQNDFFLNSISFLHTIFHKFSTQSKIVCKHTYNPNNPPSGAVA